MQSLGKTVCQIPDPLLAAAVATAGRLLDRLCSNGLRALTTMLMLGRKSASYCTHRAATAAICFAKMR